MMRKWNAIFCVGALAIFVAGCASDVASVEPEFPDNVIEQDVYSDVPIEFGYGGLTKAAGDGMDEFLPKDSRYFGVFTALKDTGDLSNKGKLTLKDNTTLRYVEDYGFRIGYPSEDRVFYYPDSDEEYSFYAYYSLTNASRISETKDTLYLEDDSYKVTTSKIYLHMTKSNDLSTSGNVLWAKACAQDDASIDGFNANIVRAGHRPYFKFSHPMAKVYFTVTLAETPSSPLGDMRVRLDMLSLVNSPSEIDLCLVDSKGEKEGLFENPVYPDVRTEYYWYDGVNIPNEILADIQKMAFLKDESNGSRNLNCSFDAGDEGVTKTPGSGCVLIPPREPENPLVCRLRIAYMNAKTGVISGFHHFDVTLDPRDYGYNEGYKAGVEYRYNIVIDHGKIRSSEGKVYLSGPFVKGKWLNENQYSKKTAPEE